MLIDKLPESITMQLYLQRNDTDVLSGQILYSSSKKWLHPLLDLQEFLTLHSKYENRDCQTFEFEGGVTASPVNLILRDRVIGRAAAFLIIRMGIRKVETDLISRGALALLNANSVSIEAIETTDAIKCITEDLLKDITDSEKAFSILTERRTKELNRMTLTHRF